MPQHRDPFVREKFTKERIAARKRAAEYFQRFPKQRYQVENWRELQSQNIEFTMKRLCEAMSRAAIRMSHLATAPVNMTHPNLVRRLAWDIPPKNI